MRIRCRESSSSSRVYLVIAEQKVLIPNIHMQDITREKEGPKEEMKGQLYPLNDGLMDPLARMQMSGSAGQG